MSEPYSVSIIKFTGGFTNLAQLNADLAANTASEFMGILNEAATDQGISPLRLFAPPTYGSGSIGIISQDEGSIFDNHNEITNYYVMFDDSDCDIISSYLLPGSKLVISFHYDVEQEFYVFEHNTWSKIDIKNLF